MQQIPDFQQLRIRNKKPVVEGTPVTFGAIDKNALEAAVQLRAANGGEVIVVSVGNEELEDTIKEALAGGGDSAVLVADDETAELQSFDNAAIIAELVKGIDDAQLILFAEGSGDNYSGQVGSIVANLLGYPQVGFVTAVEVQSEKVIVTRALENGDEVVEVALPAVLMIAAGLNTPRIPAVTAVLKAGKKPKVVKTLDELDYQPAAAKIKTLENLAPNTDRKQQQVKNVDDILGILSEEGLLGR